MRKNKIVHGNIYYSIQKDPVVIVKFVMSNLIYICNPRLIFETFPKAKVKAVKLLNKNHFEGLKRLEKSISDDAYHNMM